jgi:hypothetical protein
VLDHRLNRHDLSDGTGWDRCCLLTHYGAWGTDGAVREASLDGTNPQTIVTGQLDTMGVAINSSNLYWVGQHGIWETNLDGTNPQLSTTTPARGPRTMA